jgi:O-antigen ligase
VRTYLEPLVALQRFFIPALFCLTAWAVWQTLFKKDTAVGLGLYVCLVLIVDGYLNTGIYLPGIEKGSIRYSEVCAIFLLFNSPSVTSRRAPWGAVTWPIMMYFGLMLAAVLRSDPMLGAVLEFRSVILPQIVAYMVGRRGLDSPAAFRRFFLTVSVAVFFIGIFDFWDIFFDRWILRSDVLNKPIYFHNRKHGRFGSILLNPNYLGAFIVLIFPPVFAWALNEARMLGRLIAWSSLFLMVFCLAETQSRAPLLALGIGVLSLVLGPCGGLSRRRRMGVLGAFVVAFAVLMPGFLERASGRFSEIDSEMDEGRSRETTWRYTMRMIGDYPLTGIGFGEHEFQKMMNAYGFFAEFNIEPLDAPHNSYLQAAVYAGLPALAAFLFANIVLLGKAMSFAIRGEGSNTSTVFGLAIGILGFLAVIFPDVQLFTGNIAPIYWVFFGLLLALVTGTTVPATAAVAVPAAATVTESLPVRGGYALPRPVRPAREGSADRLRGRSVTSVLPAITLRRPTRGTKC